MDPTQPSTPPPAVQPGQATNPTMVSTSTPQSNFAKPGIVKILVGIFIALIAIALIAGSGFFAYKLLGGNNSSEQAKLIASPKPILKSSTPATNSAEATSSATIDPADLNLMDFASPCMSFKYPKNWTDDNQTQVIDKHLTAQGFDNYGLTTTKLYRKYTQQNIKTDAYIVNVKCGPNAFGSDLSKLRELAKTGSMLGLVSGVTVPDVKITDTKLDNMPAVKLSFNALKNNDGSEKRSGKIEITSIDNETYLDIQLLWDFPAQDDPTSAGQKEFQSIVDSVQINDYFHKQ